MQQYHIGLFFLSLSFFAKAQLSSKRCINIPIGKLMPLDTLLIDPGSIQFVDDPDYSFNVSTSEIFVNGDLGDSLNVCFHVFPFSLNDTISNKPSYLYDSNVVFRYPLNDLNRSNKREELIDVPGINKNGSLTRGISVGNTQSVFVNSNLNLQLEGQVSEDVSISAVISDQNVPFQPDGNTQQIQEFDRVYLQLSTKRSTLTGGDIILKNEPSHFLKYQRNLQGGSLAVDWSDSTTSTTRVSAALSKGKFATNNILPLDGVQGPYKLVGPDNERFILVLANSETVYLDGKALSRGWDFDYTIDYNQAEITFTNSVLITQYSRIRVDFEYSDRNYARTTLSADHNQEINDKLSMSVNFYQEKDNRNNPLNIDLSDADKRAISEVGDNLSQSFIQSFDSVSFDHDLIMYKVDTVIEGVDKFPIFVFSSNPDSADYQVVFTEVGVGRGNYVRDRLLANGSIYEWAGVGLGTFLPVRIVPTPKQKRMLEAGLKYKVKAGEFNVSGAFSSYDQNLYSEFDDNDNNGGAIQANFNSKAVDLGQGFKVDVGAGYEFTDSSFQRIDRFRYVEFDRDWSANSAIGGNNHLAHVRVNAFRGTKNKVKYELNIRDKQNDVNGLQHHFDLFKVLGKWQLNNRSFLLNGKFLNDQSNWLRVNTEVKRKGVNVTPGIFYNLDHNKVSDQKGNVLRTAMYYDEIGGFFEHGDSSKYSMRISQSYREDRDTSANELILSSVAHVSSLLLSKKGKKQQIKITGTYRQIDFKKDTLAAENNIMGRVDWNLNMFRNAVRSDLTYATSNGRELKREFIFLEVPVGEGTHVFRDLNGDGLQSLDELVPDDLIGNFVRTFVPTDEFIAAYTNSLNYRLNLRPPKNLSLLSRFSNVTSLNYAQRTTDENLNARFNPLHHSDPIRLLSSSQQLRSTLFYNRSSPTYGGNFVYAQSSRKRLLTSGFDSVFVREMKLTLRYNLTPAVGLRLVSGNVVNGSSSDFLVNNVYQILRNDIAPELTYQPSRSWRHSVSLRYEEGEERFNSIHTNTVEFGYSFRNSKVGKRSVEGSLTYVGLKHNQNEIFSGTVIGYTMLNGLNKGNNFKWQLNYRQQLINGLQLVVNYEGRKPDGSQLVHLGRIQLTALF